MSLYSEFNVLTGKNLFCKAAVIFVIKKNHVKICIPDLNFTTILFLHLANQLLNLYTRTMVPM